MSAQGLAYAYSEPLITASYKVNNEDFKVREILNFEPDGEGDHLFLLVEKNGITTQDVQKRIMKYFNLTDRDVSYSGMKDKQALTQQWFSVKLQGRELADVKNLNSNKLQIQRALKNKRKLKRGSHRSNQFSIRLRDLNQIDPLIGRLQDISLSGISNYFGEQRFGRNGDNVFKAKQLFTGALKVNDRYQRGIYISAARAHLFNQILSYRVESKTWNAYLPGDLMSLEGSSSSFKPDSWDHILAERLDKQDIHPTGAMWGAGELLSGELCALTEEKVISAEPELKLGLEQTGLGHQRRPLRSIPRNLSYKVENATTVVLEFSLSKGTYATSFLRELVKLRSLDYR